MPEPAQGWQMQSNDFFEFFPSSTRRHAYKLYKVRRSSTGAIFFAWRVINVWNSLPDTVSFTSLSTFKRSIKMGDFFTSF